MTGLRLAASLVVTTGLAAVACNPVYSVGSVSLSNADAGDGGLDAGDGGDAGLDGGDGGKQLGSSCVDVDTCNCGQYCGSTGTVDGGNCNGEGSDICFSDVDCMDEGPGAKCLIPVMGASACSRGHCYPGSPDGGSCASDSDCPCTSACAQLDGGPPGCVPLTAQMCSIGGSCTGGATCVNVYRDGGVCGALCRPFDE
jgi:hypothetical protein